MMDNTQPLNPDPFEKICIEFIDGFCRAFVITGNGSLGCDQAICGDTPMCYNSQELLIANFVGFAPPVLRLQEPAGQSDITMTNHNKIEMILACVYAFIMYHKMCTVIGYTTTMLHQEYTPNVDDVETDNDAPLFDVLNVLLLRPILMMCTHDVFPLKIIMPLMNILSS
jgi:hypothetical protein